jgi:HK97 family phage prohead protease
VNLIEIEPSALRARAKMLRQYGKLLARNGPLFAKSHEDEYEPRLAIEGWAVLTDEPIGTKTGDILVLEKGCFDSFFASGETTEMWLSHKETEVIASTNSGLEFAVTDEGHLAYRLALTNGRYASKIEQMVTSGKQACVSVGITRTEERQEKVGEHTVTFISKADLRELSLVALGACSEAFARLIDLNYALSLRDSIASLPFKIESSVHNAKAQQGKTTARLDRLNERLAALESEQHDTFSIGDPSLPWRDDWLSNGRYAIERYDQLRTEHRARLGV